MDKKEKILIFVLASVQFTAIMDFMIMMPLGPQLMRIFQINPQEFGFLVSAYTFAAGLSSFIGVFWIDNFDRKKALMNMYLGFLLGTLACALSPTYTVLVLSRILTGIFGGLLMALVFSIIGDVIEEKRRGTAMGYVSTSFSLASVLGVPFGLFIASFWNWHAPFFFLVAIGTPIYFMIMKYVPEVKAHLVHKTDKTKPYDTLVYILKNSNLRMALVFIMMLVLGQFTIVPFISPYMSANIGFSDRELTLIYFIGGAATILTSPKIGKLSDKYGKPKVFMVMALLSLIPIFFVTNLPPVSIPIALIFTTLVFVCFSGRFVPATAYITSVVSNRYRGGFMSINSAFMQIASGIASLVAGFIVVESPSGELLNYPYVGYIAMVFTVIAIFMIHKIKPAKEETAVAVQPEEEKEEAIPTEF